jgi:thiamine transport system substrate-binding protein
VLEGAANPAGAQALVDFMLSDTFQADIPAQMYVYPASASAGLPADWERFAPLSPSPFEVAPEQIATNRQEWIERWTDVVIG